MANLTYNGNDLDLNENTRVALTFSFMDYQNPVGKKGNFSKTIKLPATKKNQQILGTPLIEDDTNNTDNTAIYYGDDGVILFDGKLEVRKRKADIYECVLFGNTLSITNILGKKKLNEVDLGSQTYTTTTATASWTNSTPVVYPFIDYGDWDVAGDFEVNQLRPAVRVVDIIDKIFNDAGMTVDVQGSLLWLWVRLIVPFVSGEVIPNADYLTSHSLHAFNGVASPFVIFGSIPVNFTGLTDPNGHGSSIFNNAYFTSFKQMYGNQPVYKVEVKNMKLTFDPTIASPLNQAKVSITNGTSGVDLWRNAAVGDTEMWFGRDEWEEIGNLSSPESVQWVLDVFAGSGIVNVQLAAGYEWRMTPISMPFQTGEKFDIGQNLPDMTQVEFFSSLVRTFNLIPTISDNKLTLKTWADNFNESVDFTDKINVDKNSVEKLKFLKKKLIFAFKKDSDDLKLQEQKDLGNDLFNYPVELDDDFLTEEKTLKIEIAPTYMGASRGLQMPQMYDKDHTAGAGNRSHEPRLLIYEGLKAGNFNLLDNETGVVAALTSYPYATFHGIDEILNYYSELISAYNVNKLLITQIFLTNNDVQNLDLSKKVIIGDSTFIINKIQDWQEGKPTRIELIRL